MVSKIVLRCFIHASLSSYSPDSCPGFPILPVPDDDPRFAPLDPRSPVFYPGFPTLPVPDDDPHFAPLDPCSPVSCPGFPTLPVPDDDPRFAPHSPFEYGYAKTRLLTELMKEEIKWHVWLKEGGDREKLESICSVEIGAVQQRLASQNDSDAAPVGMLSLIRVAAISSGDRGAAIPQCLRPRWTFTEPSASLDQCPLKWWSEHTAVYGHQDHQHEAKLSTIGHGMKDLTERQKEFQPYFKHNPLAFVSDQTKVLGRRRHHKDQRSRCSWGGPRSPQRRDGVVYRRAAASTVDSWAINSPPVQEKIELTSQEEGADRHRGFRVMCPSEQGPWDPGVSVINGHLRISTGCRAQKCTATLGSQHWGMKMRLEMFTYKCVHSHGD
ncbi:hypothetical protein N1851_019839 [Merluccius polli]|uniref:Uncharacterized protein n=1 Tax=Merluccius polli TaxID=89951 RepID=A0AA47MLP8_MERPO|nr:hypothetical protein N1851_019839 [Merluccius polli]